MDLIDNMNQDWESANPDDHKEFAEYTVIRSRMVKPGEFEVAVKQLTDEGDIPHIMAKLLGTQGKCNPLAGVRNCELLVSDKNILGINVAGDCVVCKKK